LSTNQLDQEIREIQKNLTEILTKRTQNLEDFMELHYDDPRILVIEEERERLKAQHRELSDRHHELLYLRSRMYERPQGRIVKYFSAMLGPLPEYMEKIDPKTERSREIVESLPSYRTTALAMLFMVASAVIGIGSYFPVLFVSPLSLLVTSTSDEGGASGIAGLVNVLVVIVLCILLFMFVFRRQALKRAIFSAALNEEQWFRSGSENWTYSQRIIGCLSFGFCHVINLIYPVVSLLVLSAAGAVLMAVYLAEYRRTRDVERATLASAKLHAVYNLYAVTLILFIFVLASSLTLLA
jgi:hypothetical protein